MCGVVRGGIVPGLWGYEAGQSGVGDIFAWFVDNAVPPRYHDEARGRARIHEHLSALAGEQEVGEHGLVALDWHNGNRSVLVDHELSGLIVGLTLRTRPRTSTARWSRRQPSARGRSSRPSRRRASPFAS